VLTERGELAELYDSKPAPSAAAQWHRLAGSLFWPITAATATPTP